jgi:hypothetical protein
MIVVAVAAVCQVWALAWMVVGVIGWHLDAPAVWQVPCWLMAMFMQMVVIATAVGASDGAR